MAGLDHITDTQLVSELGRRLATRELSPEAQRGIQNLVVSGRIKLETALSPEMMQGLARFQQQYNSLPLESLPLEARSRFTWEETKNRLTANNCLYLHLALGMDQGVLFGVDREGNPLIADGRDKCVVYEVNEMTGKLIPIYNCSAEKAERVSRYSKWPKYDQILQEICGRAGSGNVGYELFPNEPSSRGSDGVYRSDEVSQFERNLNRLFVYDNTEKIGIVSVLTRDDKGRKLYVAPIDRYGVPGINIYCFNTKEDEGEFERDWQKRQGKMFGARRLLRLRKIEI